jgi:hypothetical protein
MKRLLYVCLAALALFPGPRLRAQSISPAQLEVNLGPIAIDWYDGTSTYPNNDQGVPAGPDVPACSFTDQGSNYRGCVQAVLNNYGSQGVVGVRFQFGMTGDGWSTPFTSQTGTMSTTWLNNLSLFFQDLRAANIQWVSMTPGWIPWGEGNMTIQGCTTTGSTAVTLGTCQNAVFYPWLHFGLPALPKDGGTFSLFDPNGWNNAPYLGYSQGAWQWGPGSSYPLYNFFDQIFGAVAQAQLAVREIDLCPETSLSNFPVYARLISDQTQLPSPGNGLSVLPLGFIRNVMEAHGLGGWVTMSTGAGQPQMGAACTSPLTGTSELVLDADELLSATLGGPFGWPAYGTVNGVTCAIGWYGSPSYIASEPLPNILDIHTYPADSVTDAGFGQIGNPNSSGCWTYPDDERPITNVQVFNADGTPALDPYGNDEYVQDCSADMDGDPVASSQNAAHMIYSAMSTLLSNYQQMGYLPGANLTIGETDEYNPGGYGRDGLYFPPLTEAAPCATYGPFGITSSTNTRIQVRRSPSRRTRLSPPTTPFTM